jgi:hypothetical protein
MRRVTACAFLIVVLCSTAIAGQVYGTIFRNGQKVPGAQITLRCPGGQSVGTTDNTGVYRVFGRGTGTCALVLNLPGLQAEGSLYSYDRPTGYDFDLAQQDGKWRLIPRRR